MSEVRTIRPFIVRFWGTRGSMPVAATAKDVREKIVDALLTAQGRSFESRQDAERFAIERLGFAGTATYGGATCCVEIDCNDDAFFICDMGSGLHPLGVDASSRCAAGRRKRYNFFLSHLHTDHLLGLPAFLPGRDVDSEIIIHSCHAETEELLCRQLAEATHARPQESWEAALQFVTLTPGQQAMIDGILVDTIEQQHPGDSYGYRFTNKAGRTVIYSTDSEHNIDDMQAGEERFVTFFEGADLVICDTMYSLAKSTTTKEHQGHSSNVVAIDLCHLAGAKRLALFHHDPLHDDADIQQLHEDSVRYEELTREGPPLEIFCAYDGLEVRV